MSQEDLWKRTTTCRSCGASIIWSKTSTGRKMPVDALPSKGVVLTDEHEPTASVVDVYTSHFATCPNADKHRTKR